MRLPAAFGNSHIRCQHMNLLGEFCDFTTVTQTFILSHRLQKCIFLKMNKSLQKYKTNPKHILGTSKIIQKARAAVTVCLASNPLVQTCTTDVMFVMGKTLCLCNVLKADESAICLFQFSRKQKPEKLF